jgi:outer membrane protein OmpA-like peptidoglycan-associated protein
MLALGACAVGSGETGETDRSETRSYVVFFGYESTTLTPTAREIVVQAATHAKSMKPARIDLGGYLGQGPTARTDSALTARRFAAVEEVLEAEGVDRTLFAHVPLVDEVPLPATAVRRVEIHLVEK